jgi:crotonobetainyl-CoA:carnitine CoA-transferase CaiB-like acyl-CoA transferase
VAHDRVLAALRERDATGAGTRLSTALYDTALAWNAYHLAGCIDTGFVPRPMGSELPMIAPYGAFATADGRDHDRRGQRRSVRPTVCRADSNVARVAHREDVNDAVRGRTRTMTTADLLVRLRDHGVPCAPIQDIAEVCADEQTGASGMIARSGGATALRLPVRFDGVRPEAGTPPPRAGEHTAAVLAELGLD